MKKNIIIPLFSYMREAQQPLSSSRYAISSSESDSVQHKDKDAVSGREREVNTKTQTESLIGHTSSILTVLVPAKLLHHLFLCYSSTFKFKQEDYR